ncbi:MAG: CBS domain-containing protein [Rhodanobacter sp.]
MKVDEIMTRNPRVCMADVPLTKAAQMMRDEDVGEIPVVDAERKVVGVITDRDIVVRCVATGDNPQDVMVEACMTAPALTLPEGASLEECARMMAAQQVRRIPIVDANGAIRGIVAQADVEGTDARSLKAQIAERVSVPH